jgi:hypothetical protein
MEAFNVAWVAGVTRRYADASRASSHRNSDGGESGLKSNPDFAPVTGGGPLAGLCRGPKPNVGRMMGRCRGHFKTTRIFCTPVEYW